MKVLLGFLGVGLLIYAVIDCSRTPEEEVPSSLPRSGWLVLIILLPFLGPLFWLFTSRTEGGGASSGSSSPAARQGQPPRNGPTRNGPTRNRPPLGPDDDPDFLRGL
jgi:hypothetical protein